MIDDWIDVLLSGSYDIKLPTLSVTSGSTEPMLGSGTINWRADSGIRLQAVTDGGKELNQIIFEPMQFPGTLIPHSTYLTFSGHTQNNWDVSTYPTSRDGCSLNSSRPEVVWDLSIDGVTLEHKSSGNTNRLLRILIGPLPQGGWTRFTETEVTNEYFGGSSSHRDWLYSYTNFGQIAARQRSIAWFEVQVFSDDGKPMGDPDKICTAVARAFGFILGRRSAIRGYELINEGKTTRRFDIRHSKSTKNTLLPPLGWQMTYLSNIERLLGPTIDFFLTELGERVAAFLYVCWDAADNAHQTQLAISCICVEGLLQVAAETMGPTKPDNCSADFAALEKWVEGQPSGFSTPFLMRLIGLKSMFSSLGAKDIFRDWIAREILAVTREDMDAWSSTRNPSAHGKLTTTAESQPKLQVQANRHARVQSILNRIILKMIGYTGEYVDYSRHGYPPAMFPSEPPSVTNERTQVTPHSAPPVGGATR